VRDVLDYLGDTLDARHPFTQVHAGPGPATMPAVWLLGSRYESAHLAAAFGLPFSYAHFFGLGVEEGPRIVESYRQHFRPSDYSSEPRVNVSVHVICADTAAQAQRLAASRNLTKLKTTLGRREGVPSVAEALAYPYTVEDIAYIREFSASSIEGDPQQVKAQLETIRRQYNTSDIGIVTVCYDFADRVRSYELVAEACGLKR
jgi:luciferase family oxidoreductase group 1